MPVWIALTNIYRQIHNWIGRREEPEKYHLFHFNMNWSMRAIEKHMHFSGYFYNDLSTSMIGQVGTWRRLIGLDHQIHIRLYKSGLVTGHFELATHHGTDHLMGVDYRPLTKEEIAELKIEFSGLIE